jgi:hypothetical protein
MIDRFKVLRLLSTVFAVFAWVALAWMLFALLTAQIADEQIYDNSSHFISTGKKGIGFVGAVAILIDGALRFLTLLGASQAIKLWLQMDASISGLSMRLGDITGAMTELRMQQVKTIEQVRMIGTIVYEEAKKDG